MAGILVPQRFGEYTENWSKNSAIRASNFGVMADPPGIVADPLTGSQRLGPVHMIGDTLGKGKVERGGNPKVMIYQVKWERQAAISHGVFATPWVCNLAASKRPTARTRCPGYPQLGNPRRQATARLLLTDATRLDSPSACFFHELAFHFEGGSDHRAYSLCHLFRPVCL